MFDVRNLFDDGVYASRGVTSWKSRRITRIACNCALRDISIGNGIDKGRVWIKQHNMKMLNGVNAFQAFPVFKPGDLTMSVEVAFSYNAESTLRDQAPCANRTCCSHSLESGVSLQM